MDGKMNVYQKLQRARVELQKKELKKTGKNNFSNFDYFELSDFLPQINEIFYNLGLCSIINYSLENAVLTIHNIDEPSEKIEFVSPSANVTLKGCHPIQNIGAVETYQRRYLYMTALEIVESDVLDSTVGKTEKNNEPVVICDSCGEAIKPYQNRTVDEMVKGSLRAYGKKLCCKCCLKEKAKIKKEKAEKEKINKNEVEA